MLQPMVSSRRVLFLPLAMILLAWMAGAPFAIGSAPSSKAMSVGDFAVLLSSKMHAAESSGAPATPEAASELLQKAGIKLGKELSAPLTEGDAARILKQFNISLEPREADALLDYDRAVSLVGIFGSTVSAKGAFATSSPNGKGTGVEASAGAAAGGLMESIADCQSLPRTQDCQQCCRSLLGGTQNENHTNRICGKACNTKARNVSASEPTP
jgi:hypothetical protein